MGWNGSDLASTSRAASKRGSSRTPSPHSNGVRNGLIALVLIALVGGAAWWFLSTPMSQPTPVPEEEETPAPVERTVARDGETPAKARKSDALAASTAETLAQVEAAKSALEKPVKKQRAVITNRIDFGKSRYDVFKHDSERELAFLGCVPIGTLIIGDRDFDEEFMKDLEAALKEPIHIADDDPEDVKYYKESVIELKKQLAEMKANGMNIAEELSKSRKELQKLGVYKLELEMEIDKIREEYGDTMTPDEVERFVNGANELLAKKGIEPFTFSKLSCSIIQRMPFPTPEQAEAEELAIHGDPNDPETAALLESQNAAKDPPPAESVPADEPTVEPPAESDGERDVASDVETDAPDSSDESDSSEVPDFVDENADPDQQ